MTKAVKILGYISAASVVLGVLMNLGDLRRYIKIEMM
jgi:hypothetical protein